MKCKNGGCCQSLVITARSRKTAMLVRAGTMEEADMQTAIARGGGHKFFTRFLAATALIAVYCLSTVGIVMSTSATPAFARGRGGG
jgi:hypothetical protein